MVFIARFNAFFQSKTTCFTLVETIFSTLKDYLKQVKDYLKHQKRTSKVMVSSEKTLLSYILTKKGTKKVSLQLYFEQTERLLFRHIFFTIKTNNNPRPTGWG